MQAPAYGKGRRNVNGWFAVARDIFEHPVVGAGHHYSRLEAWLWLVNHAAYNPTPDLQSGELLVSKLELARKWGWTRSMVRHFFNSLHRAQMLTTAATNRATKISLLNYEKWQFQRQHKSQQNNQLTANGGATLFNKEDTRHETRSADMAALDAFNAYNALALKLGLSQAATLTPDRKQKLKARLKEHGPEAWQKALANLEASPFLRGEGSNWRANLDFVLQRNSYTKLLEGAYAGKGKLLVPKVATTVRDTSETFEQLKARTGWKPPEGDTP